MCCIFTCVGWIIDLIQRLWTFTMSCLISSAICCSMATASMSGIALGYNYSLAEYMDLKETNVSVYLKRGVFDDEVADDMDWRRSGHMPVEGHLRDSNLMTAPPNNEEMPVRSGRRMDDSLVVSDDHHKYEGSLMRLTVKPPSYKSSTEPVTSDEKMAEVLQQFPSGSMEQIKAIQSVLNNRRANNFHRNTKRTTLNEMPTMPLDILGRRMGGIAPGGVPMYGPGYQPMYERNPAEINPARFAVPDMNIGEPANWFLPKDRAPESYRRTMEPEDTNLPPSIYTYPSAIIFTKDLKRPTRPRPKEESKPTHTTGTTLEIGDAPEDEIKKYKEMLLRERENRDKLNSLKIQKIGDREFDIGKEFKSEEDYAEQAMKGLPLKQWTTSNMIRNPVMSE